MSFRLNVLTGEAVDDMMHGFDLLWQEEVEQRTKLAAEKATVRVRKNVAGIVTTPIQMKLRSGHAHQSMANTVISTDRFQVIMRVGAINAPPDVGRYLGMHERPFTTITPVRADKLAFPPGEAGQWHPSTRNALGEQLTTARDLIGDPEAYGFERILTLENSIVGFEFGADTAVLLFIRRRFVRITGRRPIGREQMPTVDRLVDDLERINFT